MQVGSSHFRRSPVKAQLYISAAAPHQQMDTTSFTLHLLVKEAECARVWTTGSA